MDLRRLHISRGGLGLHKEAAVPEEALNGLSMHSPPKIPKTGGEAEDVPEDLISVKAAVGEQSEDEDKIKEYLKRSDTAVIFPEPVGQQENKGQEKKFFFVTN